MDSKGSGSAPAALRRVRSLVAVASLCALTGAAAWAADAARPEALRVIQPRPVATAPAASRAMLLGLARAGQGAVAVGERGVVLLADQAGVVVRQADSVPVDATLTSVHFIDASRGWAVGHWGAILATTDGGRSWIQQRLDLDADRPLFAVHFIDAQHGVAVGLWSLVLCTDDGGRNWREVELEVPPGARKADLNLLGLFADTGGRLYATAERGMVLLSADGGRHWRYLATGAKGSLWSGVALGDGTLIVGGQRGALWRSEDGGTHWQPIASGGKSSITALAADGEQVAAVGLDGYVATSVDAGRSFTAQPREDRLSLTAVVPAGPARWLYASRTGLVGSAAGRARQ